VIQPFAGKWAAKEELLDPRIGGRHGSRAEVTERRSNLFS